MIIILTEAKQKDSSFTQANSIEIYIIRLVVRMDFFDCLTVNTFIYHCTY